MSLSHITYHSPISARLLSSDFLIQVKWVSSHGPAAFAYFQFTECMDDE